MKKEKPPWLLPFATIGGVWGVMFVVWLAGSPPDALLRRIGAGLACAAGFAGVVGAILLALRSSATSRVRGVSARRAGWEVVAAWADESLAGTLAALGVEQAPPRAPAALVVAYSHVGLELWRGGRRSARLFRVGWQDVESVQAVPASCGSLAMHGVAVRLRQGAVIVVCPSRRPTGGAAGASAREVDILVEHLRRAGGSVPRR